MVTFGLAALGCAVLCLMGFVAAVVRADHRLQQSRPASMVGEVRGPARLWLLAAVVCAVVGFALIGTVVARAWS